MPSLLKVLKAFTKDAEYLPIAYPVLPTPQFGSSGPTEIEAQKFREVFEAHEANFYKTIAEIDARFETAQARMNLCSFLSGFLNPFALNSVNIHTHFKWCPHDVWMMHTRDEPNGQSERFYQFQ